ncbi:hypothetical protein SAICODRAFT_107341 [Saitoella complicata NRRL Y-17804]|uniref:uncharacterized protein n=1 Tax=Saitoella complicata (strain BCRC 22490 / CBS 7301 / JCM 7358 / NBRC 10748 / NRRL Y-17804) TaxID=698492 RepID=UPI000866ADC1|nr:uncharacterized protein SAICODRAFT_107341 [Saitoella complicata NRRL Y-17804]ODQ56354.1 hypothetical protein SAICODRAFT_107341 [Saitoella complicata NRRL Y-17804]
MAARSYAPLRSTNFIQDVTMTNLLNKATPASPNRQTTNTIVLDYMLFQATGALIKDYTARVEEEKKARAQLQAIGASRNRKRQTQDSSSRRLVGLVDGLIASYHGSPGSSLILAPILVHRIHLCTLLSVLSGRYEPQVSSASLVSPASLQKHRKRNRDRMRRYCLANEEQIRFSKEITDTWTSRQSELPIAPRHRRDRTPLSKDPLANSYRAVPGLRDALDDFMLVSAMAMKSLGSSLGDLWLEIAVEFMKQAALEAFLSDGAKDFGSFKECFAWGRIPEDRPELRLPASDRSAVVQEIFDSFTEEEMAQFNTSIDQAVSQFIPPTETSLEVHLLKLGSCDNLLSFEGKLVEFLTTVNTFIGKPELAKYEAGLHIPPTTISEQVDTVA